MGLSCSRIPPLLPLPLEGTRWLFPLLWNRCSHSTCLTELSLPCHPLKPASTPDALLVTASHSPHARLLFLFSASTSSCSACPQSSCQSDGFQAAPTLLCSRLCSGTPPPPQQQPPTVSPPRPAHPDLYPLVHRPFILPIAPFCHHCEPSVLGQQALTQCKTLSSIT